jgi:formylglycine-generating enzyme required for sulfatase activity
MGSPDNEIGRDWDEGPQTQVTLTQGFWMGRHEVTQAEFSLVMQTNPSRFLGLPEQPVEQITWAEAVEFCARVTDLERQRGQLPAGYVYRLPTEAEWEYAARAGSTTRFSFGDDPGYSDLVEHAWALRNAFFSTHPVGRRLPSPWGLYDLYGNVAEWCSDWYGDYPGGGLTDPAGPADGDNRVIRGGSFYDDGEYCRSAYRLIDWTADRFYNVGFRVVLGRPLVGH